MTGYVYNPSKKVTDLLSQYLEFDPEQIQVAIWSGHLSLTDVKLKHETFYDKLNDLLANLQQQQQQQQTDDGGYQKPPLRCQILSATMGNLELKIPWKRLVWGQSDVKVHVKNLAIVVSLESRDEQTGKGETDSNADDEDSSAGARSPTKHASRRGSDPFDDEYLASHPSPTTRSERRSQRERPDLIRTMKQARLQEAERRLLQGLPFGAWMESARKRDHERYVKMLASANAESEEKQAKTVDRWFKSTMNDFFWRFYVGLEMTVENMKITIIQDGIEIGVVFPSTTISSNNQSAPRAPPSRHGSAADLDESTMYGGGNTAADNNFVPPENMVYRGEHEDGEHVDKSMKILGLGVYIRKMQGSGDPQAPASMPHESVRFGGDVTAKEYLLRPVDVSFGYSLFYPYPPDKRKRRRSITTTGEDNTATTATDTSLDKSIDGSTASTSSKRRRGKREKTPFSVNAPEPLPEGSTLSSSPRAVTPARALNPMNPESTAAKIRNRRMSIAASNLPPATQRRMSMSIQQNATNSVSSERKATSGVSSTDSSGPAGTTLMSAGNVPTTNQLNTPDRRQSMMFRSSAGRPIRHRQTTSGTLGSLDEITAPLVQPDNLSSAYLVATKGTQKLNARLDVNVSIGAIQFVCSTGHYKLFNMFLAASARIRNGRPTKTIMSVLNEAPLGHSSLFISKPLRSSSTEKSITATTSGTEVRLQLSRVSPMRRIVVRLWWKYALQAVIWELRQREKLRKKFQEKYLHFSWERQHYRRPEYVKLYIALVLDKNSNSMSDIWTSNEARQEELLQIEDEICVEQILLYRTLARAVYVRGGKEMPRSICGLRDNAEKERGKDEDASVPTKSGTGKSPDVAQSSRMGNEVVPTFLSNLTAMGETARSRYRAKTGQRLCSYSPRVSPGFVGTSGQRSLLGESTLGGATMVTKTSSKSLSIKTFEMSKITDNELNADNTMITSFKVDVEKLEVSVVEEEIFDYVTELNRVSQHDGSVHSDATSSDVSVLTDDQKFFEDHDGDVAANDMESFDGGPIMSSTDFLLFKTPENVLLKFELVPLSFSMQGRSGGARNIKLEIGRIDAVGENGSRILSVGSPSASRPVNEINVHGDPFELRPRTRRLRPNAIPSKAVSISLVFSSVGTILQWDTSSMKSWVDLKTFEKIREFSKKSSAQFPTQVLPKSAKEDVRLYVLKQNTTASMSRLNSSIRIHGLEVIVQEPGSKPEGDSSRGQGDGADSIEADGQSRAGIVVRSGLIEVYSGTALNALESNSSADGLHSTGSISSRTPRPATRTLRMLNVAERTMARSSILSNHWVRRLS